MLYALVHVIILSIYFDVVIEVQIPTNENLMNIKSISFPTVISTSNSSSVFSNMTTRIQIPSTVIINQIRNEGVK